MAHQLPELSELSQREVFTVLMCHPVDTHCPQKFAPSSFLVPSRFQLIEIERIESDFRAGLASLLAPLLRPRVRSLEQK